MKAVIKLESETRREFPDLNRNDVEQKVAFDIITFDNSIVNLTGDAVQFKVRQFNETTLKIDAACTIDDPAAGQCSYTTQAGDLDTAGVYKAELQITEGTKVTTIPLGQFRVLEDLP